MSAKIRVADHCSDQDQASHGLEDLDWDLHQHQALLQHLQQQHPDARTENGAIAAGE